MIDWWLILSGTLGAVGVALGAFGAHALRGKLSEAQTATFETGVRYQMYHVFALLTISILVRLGNASPLVTIAGILFAVGIGLFSGSLYLLVFSGKKWLGAITPLGGTAWIAAWILLAVSAGS